MEMEMMRERARVSKRDESAREERVREERSHAKKNEKPKS